MNIPCTQKLRLECSLVFFLLKFVVFHFDLFVLVRNLECMCLVFEAVSSPWLKAISIKPFSQISPNCWLVLFISLACLSSFLLSGDLVVYVSVVGSCLIYRFVLICIIGLISLIKCLIGC